MSDQNSGLSESSKKEITALVEDLLEKFKTDSRSTIQEIERRVNELIQNDKKKRLGN